MGRNVGSKVWSERETERLTLFRLEGMSAMRIGRELKRSRNAVIGRLKRIAEITRPEPWHPARDPRPGWLRGNKEMAR